MDTLPICKAKSKRSGMRCNNFATKGKQVCRIHGGVSTGSRTEEGKLRQKKASWKHGKSSKEAIEERKRMREFIKQCKELIER
jgi:hypothetical protein